MLILAFLMAKRKELFRCNNRSRAILLIIMAVVAACAVSLFTAHFPLEAGMMLMLFTAFSYALVLGVNSVAGLFVKKKQ